MADAESMKRSLNPLVLQLQKMELELKCLSCLKLLTSPIVMPCDHIFCCYCVSTFTETLKCPVCFLRCSHRDVRRATHVEKMITIYKNMKSIVDANLSVERKTLSSGSPSCESPASGDTTAMQKSHEEVPDKISGRKSINVQPCPPLSGKLNAEIPRAKSEVHEGAMNESRTGAPRAGEEAFEKQKTYSPPSFGNIKGSDNDSNGQSSEHVTYPEKSMNKKSAAKRMPTEIELDAKDTEGDGVTEMKRQKLSGTCNIGDARGSTSAEEEPRHVSKSECAGIQQPPTYKSSASDELLSCAFCHSSRTTEASGRMLHYSNGKPVAAEHASRPNVVHVHQKCIDWAPQVYFENDTAKNLGPELLRASKIKCSECDLKGAALGCYVKKCRKSFHVPCAVEMGGCRWDCVNFLVLCPAHTARKLPSDGSKNRRNTKANDSSGCSNVSGDFTSAAKCQFEEQETVSPIPFKDMVFCGSALSKEEKALLDNFASSTGASVTSTWKENVTHVIASTDENGACGRSLKFLLAILSGKWVLRTDWIKACMKAKHSVPEEPYEISHDVHGFFDGPSKGRIRAMEKKPKLLAGLSFYFSDNFNPNYKGYLENLVITGGGSLKNCDFSPSQSSDTKNPCAFVVYSADHRDGCNTRDLNDDDIKKRIKEAEAFAAKTGSRAIPHTWLLDSIASFKLQDVQ